MTSRDEALALLKEAREALHWQKWLWEAGYVRRESSLSADRTIQRKNDLMDDAIAKIDALLAASGEGPGCMDCGKPYSEFRLDTTLPDEQWRAIHESEGGVLCANCMVARLAKLPGAIAVRARLEIAKRWKGKRAC